MQWHLGKHLCLPFSEKMETIFWVLLLLTSDFLLRIRQLSGGLQRIFLRLTIPAKAEHDSSLVLLRLFMRYLAGNVSLPRNMWHGFVAERERTVQGE